jgi:ketosteroid isomerase-like protein
MAADVPPVIRRYLTAGASADGATVADCFTDDAIVHDDGRTHHGRAQIIAWRDELAAAFDYTVEVIGAERTGPGHHLVRSRVEGTSPVVRWSSRTRSRCGAC